MNVIQIYTSSSLRNFSYIVEGSHGHLFIIDPWDAQEIMDFCIRRGGLIKGVINTHEHWDHTRGNEEIYEKTNCAVYAHPRGKGNIPQLNRPVSDGDEIQIDGQTKLKILETPGHTMAHLSLLLIRKGTPVGIFTGDTLFNAGVGNCRNGGDPNVLYETIIKKFKVLPKEIIVYPGHEYLENNLRFTLECEPSNKKARKWLRRYKEIDWLNHPVATTMEDEFEINTFLRLNSQEIRDNVKGNPCDERETFLRLREKRNSW